MNEDLTDPQNIDNTLTADANTLTGDTLKTTIIYSSLQTVGTISSGTWSATAIAANKGGTGHTTYATGDILYANSATSLSKLNPGVSGDVLISGGPGAAPYWGDVNLELAGGGVLQETHGGTGWSSYLVGDLLYADTTSTLARRSAVDVGAVLVSAGVGAPPVWSATPLLTSVSANTFNGDLNGAAPAGLLSGTTLASDVVSSSLTSVGTIRTGTWSASTIAANKGGTGLSSYAIGDLLYANTTSTLSKLADVAVDGRTLKLTMP